MGHAAGFVAVPDFPILDDQEFREIPISDPRSAVLVVCYTSGTTGMPKGVNITHYNFVACFCTSRLHVPWGKGDIFFGSQPITHMCGVLFPVIAMLDGACCALVPAKLTPREIMDAVDKHKATATLFFPTQLQAIVREMQRTGRGLPSMRAIAAGGSVLTASAATAARESFSGLKLLLNMYGMTESCGIIACDAGYYDENGRFFITERLKQMIKCMDNQVVPTELEELLLRHHVDEIDEVSVVGIPHPDFGEAPAAAVVLTGKGRTQDIRALAEKIKATVSANLAVHKHLHGGVYFVGLLPEDRDGESQQSRPGALSVEMSRTRSNIPEATAASWEMTTRTWRPGLLTTAPGV
ncbi:hypothetical protein HPB50_002965 [Hyalomma asiaticum]|uniref:Uncharacterized protein n=1 Tax=Hyalomma asiaticum TaxID=266040 RepID=A0ACB7SM27_HYAAI|nr:hypothetical protein HPB50_002965 [Hyalomma asiaticum]